MPPKTILVVDDEVDILVSLKSFLETGIPNVRVRTAASGDEALALLRNEPVHLLLVDYRLPGMNGLELLARAAAIEPDVPRVLMTAYPQLDVAIQAVNDAHVDMFFTKPLNSVLLVESLTKLLSDATS